MKRLLLVLVLLLSTTAYAVPYIIEEGIADFSFESANSQSSNIGEVTNEYQAIYKNEEGTCKASLFAYPNRQLLESGFGEDFDIGKKRVMVNKEHPVYQVDNAFAWTNNLFVVLIHAEFDYTSRAYKKNSCEGLLPTYLKQYPSDGFQPKEESSESATSAAQALGSQSTEEIEWVSANTEPNEFDKERRNCPEDFDGYDIKYGIEKKDFEEIFEHCYQKEQPQQDPRTFEDDDPQTGTSIDTSKVLVAKPKGAQAEVPKNSAQIAGVSSLGSNEESTSSNGNTVESFLTRFKNWIVSWLT